MRFQPSEIEYPANTSHLPEQDSRANLHSGTTSHRHTNPTHINPFQLGHVALRKPLSSAPPISASTPEPVQEHLQEALHQATPTMAKEERVMQPIAKGMLARGLQLSQPQALLLAAWSQTHLLPTGNRLDTLLGKARAEALLPELQKRLEALKHFQNFLQHYQHQSVQGASDGTSVGFTQPLQAKTLEGFLWLTETLLQQYSALAHHWQCYATQPTTLLQPISGVQKAYTHAGHFPSQVFKAMTQGVENLARYIQRHYTHKQAYQHQPRLLALKALELLTQFIDTHPNWCTPLSRQRKLETSRTQAPLPFTLEDAWSAVWQLRRILSDERTIF